MKKRTSPNSRSHTTQMDMNIQGQATGKSEQIVYALSLAKTTEFMKVSESTNSHLLFYPGLSQWKLLSTTYIYSSMTEKRVSQWFCNDIMSWYDAIIYLAIVKIKLNFPIKIFLVCSSICKTLESTAHLEKEIVCS